MTRNKLLAFLLAAAFLFAACTPFYPDSITESKAQNETQTAWIPKEYDFDNRFGMNYDSIIETDDAYYVKLYCSTYLYYYDKATGDRGILCGKPECLHDSSLCEGRISNIGATLNRWDGRLHYYSTDSSSNAFALYSISMEGSEKSRDAVVNDPSVMSGATPQRLDYHRGRLYGWRRYETVADGKPLLCADIISIEPDSGEVKVIFSRSEEEYISQPSLYYCGKYVYICCDTGHAAEDGSYYSSVYIMRWNTETEELEEVLKTNSDELGCAGSWYAEYVDDDGQIWFTPTCLAREKGRVYLADNGKVSEAFRFNTITGGYFLIQGAAVSISIEDAVWEIRSLDGTLIFEGELDMSFLDELETEEEYKVSAVYSLMGSAGEVFISYYLYSEKGGRFAECMVRYDLTGDKFAPTVIAFAEES